jgi:hypothetical protein
MQSPSTSAIARTVHIIWSRRPKKPFLPCISEEIHIPRQKAHQLDENILLLPDENPVKA